MSQLKSKASELKWFIFLHILLFFYSLSNVCSKMAAKEEFLSFKFILFYGCIIAILGVYAIVWQQILKHIPLTTAFCNKAVGIIWGIMWGVILFGETVKWNMIVGAVIVIIGVIIVVKADEQ